MPNVAIRGVLARLCLGLAEVQPDAELLENYIATRDEAAFALLVQRHGPKVFAVCRRLLGQHQLAEDAYQATFVVLAKKAHTIQPRSAVGGFLYGVARKAALEAYAVSRRRKETLVETVPDSPAAPRTATDSDVLAMLDEEIANLSDNYRAAVVLCELDGVGRAEAAQQLGIAEGTLSSRLAAARKQLATRLKARGVVFSAGLMSSLALSANAAIPPTITSATTAVSIIATGVLRTMLLAKFKLVSTVCVLVTAIIGMSTFVPKTSMEAKAAPVQKAAKDEGLLWTFSKKTSTLTAYMPDGKEAKTIAIQDGLHFLSFTEDGTKIMFAGKDGKLADPGATLGLTLHLRDVNDSVEGVDTGLWYQLADQFVVSQDMKKIVRSRTETLENIAGKNYPRFSNVLFDLATKIETPIDVPNDFQIVQWSADGKSWRAIQNNLGLDPKLPNFRWHTVPVAGGKPTPINDNYTIFWLTPSPDGKTLLGTGYEHPLKLPAAIKWFNVTGEKATVTPVAQFEKVMFLLLRWSPDGRQVAYVKHEFYPETGITHDSTLYICNPDGSDTKKLQRFVNDNQNTTFLGWFPTKIELPKQPISAPVPKLAKDEGLLWMIDPIAGKLIAYTPDGEEVKTVTFPGGPIHADHFAGLSADGRYAMLIADGKIPGPKAKPDRTDKFTLHLLPVHEPGKLTDTGIDYRGGWPDTFITSADDEYIYRRRDSTKWDLSGRGFLTEMQHEYAVTRFDLSGKNGKEVSLPDSRHYLEGVLANGDLLVRDCSYGPRRGRPYVWSPGTESQDSLPKEAGYLYSTAYSRDGKKILAKAVHNWAITRSDPADGVYRKLLVIDRDTLKSTRIDDTIKAGSLEGFWSPDGNRVAVEWYERPENGLTQLGAGEIVVCNADGTGWKRLMKLDDPEKSFPVAQDRGHRKRLIGWFPTKRELPKQKISAPVPKVAKPRETVIVVTSPSGDQMPLEIVKPDGTPVNVARDQGTFKPWDVRLTAGHRQMVFTEKASVGPAKVKGIVPQSISWLDWEAKGLTPMRIVEEAYSASVVCSADGKSIFYSHIDVEKLGDGLKRGERVPFENWHYNSATGKKTRLKLPGEQAVIDVSADGSTLLIRTSEYQTEKVELFLTPLAEIKPVKLFNASGFDCLSPRLSPDGKRLLYVKQVEWPIKPIVGGPFIRDLATGKDFKVPLPEEFESSMVVMRACWSPDGKQIAMFWNLVDGKRARDVAGRVSVCSIDGSNMTLILKRESGGSIMDIDWGEFTLAEAEKPKQPISAPVPKGDGPQEVIVAYHAGRPVLLNENGKVVRELFAEGWGGSTGQAMLSKDGRQMAMLTDTKRDATGWMFRKLYLRDIDGKGNGDELMPEGLEALTAMWSPDGKSIITSGLVTNKTIVDGKKNPNYVSEAAIHHRIDIASKKRTELTLPAGHQIMDVSPDGKSFLTYVSHSHNAKETYKVCLVGMDGKVMDELTDGGAPIVGLRFSPDGKKVVALSYNDVDNRTAVRLSEVFILDVAAKEKMVMLPLNGLHDDAIVQSVAWSPDSRRIAFSWWTDGRTKREPKDTLSHVSIATLDDAKIRTIFSVKDKRMGSIDWAKLRLPEIGRD